MKNLQNEQAFFDLPLLGSRFHGFCSFRKKIFHLILPLVHSLSQPHDFLAIIMRIRDMEAMTYLTSLFTWHNLYTFYHIYKFTNWVNLALVIGDPALACGSMLIGLRWNLFWFSSASARHTVQRSLGRSVKINIKWRKVQIKVDIETIWIVKSINFSTKSWVFKFKNLRLDFIPFSFTGWFFNVFMKFKVSQNTFGKMR